MGCNIINNLKYLRMTLNLFSVATIISIFLTALLSLFFFITQKGNDKENKLLAALLMLFNFQIIYSFFVSIYNYQFFIEWHKVLYMFRETSFLIGPAIFFYVKTFLKQKVVLITKMLFISCHFLEW